MRDNCSRNNHPHLTASDFVQIVFAIMDWIPAPAVFRQEFRPRLIHLWGEFSLIGI